MAKKGKNKENLPPPRITLREKMEAAGMEMEEDSADVIKVKQVKWKNHSQQKAFDVIEANELTFLVGCAGTSKTMLGILAALQAFNSRAVDKIILARPAVESEESLGYLPGGIDEKLDPYMRPMFDILDYLVGQKQLKMMIEEKIIEVAAFSFMRGRTFNNAFMVIDEAQNATDTLLKLVLTRIGEGSKAVVTIDPHQCDLPHDVPSAADDIHRFKNKQGIGFYTFDIKDVVRSKIARTVLSCYGDDA